MLSHPDFHKHLRQALNHLYDYEFLRRSPLVALFGISGRADPASVLQRILRDTIEGLKPTPMDPAHVDKRKVYDILLYRYIQQFNQDEVAHHTGLSERHFRREQEKAIDYLAQILLNQYDMINDRNNEIPLPEQPEHSVSTLNEWDWLREHPTGGVTDLRTFIQGLFELMRAVAAQHRVELRLVLPQPPPQLAVHPIAFRQILLNLLQVAIYHGDQGSVTVTVETGSPLVRIIFLSETQDAVSALTRYEQESNLVQTASHLAQVTGGRLEIGPASESFRAALSVPIVEGIFVVAVDDHPEIIDLLERYTSGTRYRITGIHEPEKIFDLVGTTTPQIIVMDVMMPRVDGWEMLGRLRSHPQTAGIPVIILSILAQEDLALSLGAKALIVKPVTQERFLSVLDAVFASLG
jgi:CheY-like chemotaxis protein